MNAICLEENHSVILPTKEARDALRLRSKFQHHFIFIIFSYIVAINKYVVSDVNKAHRKDFFGKRDCLDYIQKKAYVLST